MLFVPSVARIHIMSKCRGANISLNFFSRLHLKFQWPAIILNQYEYGGVLNAHDVDEKDETFARRYVG